MRSSLSAPAPRPLSVRPTTSARPRSARFVSVRAIVARSIRCLRLAAMALAGAGPVGPPSPERARRRGDGGQTTAEYALVLLGAAAVALLLVAWATSSGKIDDLLNGVIDRILDQV